MRDEDIRYIHELEQQTKRYREEIQNAFFQLTNNDAEYANWKAQEILKKLLEGDPHD